MRGNHRLRGVCACAALVVALLPARPARAVSPVQLGVGVFGVYGVPIVQQDAGPGPLYGVKAKANLVGPLGAEAFYMSFQEGDVTFNTPLGKQTINGGSQNAFGLNVELGGSSPSGLNVYLTGGIGSYKLKKDNRPDLTRTGYNGGIGMEFRALMGLAVDVSGRLHAVPLKDGGSRKFAGIQAGVNYYFLH